jgi:hypothetical protein
MLPVLLSQMPEPFMLLVVVRVVMDPHLVEMVDLVAAVVDMVRVHLQVTDKRQEIHRPILLSL